MGKREGMRTILGCWLLLLGLAGGLVAADVKDDGLPALRYYPDAFWLGVVEGLTEFMPVSSTAHLILVADQLGLNDETPLLREDGSVFWHREPVGDQPGVMMTRKHALDTYNIVLQGGTILAVIFLYWQTILYLAKGCLRRERKAFLMVRNLALAVAPIIPIGFLVEPMINELFQVDVLVWGLLVGTLAIIAAELWRKRRMQTTRELPSEGQARWGERSWDQLSAGQSLTVGLVQCVAVIPGFSRALSVILGGYTVGLRPGQAAEFSFLIGLPTVMGAALVKGYKDGGRMLEVIPVMPLLFGLLVSAVTAVVAVWWLRRHISKYGLWGFVVYRFALVIAIFAWGGSMI